MSIIEITSDAKCKDCKFLERVPKIKKDGTASKQNRLQCSIHVQHLFKGEKTEACLKFKPKWEE